MEESEKRMEPVDPGFAEIGAWTYSFSQRYHDSLFFGNPRNVRPTIARELFKHVMVKKYGKLKYVEIIQTSKVLILIPLEPPRSEWLVSIPLNTIPKTLPDSPQDYTVYCMVVDVRTLMCRFIGGITGKSLVNNATKYEVGTYDSQGVKVVRAMERWLVDRRHFDPLLTHEVKAVPPLAVEPFDIELDDYELPEPPVRTEEKDAPVQETEEETQAPKRQRRMRHPPMFFDNDEVLGEVIGREEAEACMDRRLEALMCVEKDSKSRVSESTKFQNSKYIVDGVMMNGVQESERAKYDLYSLKLIKGYVMLNHPSEKIRSWYVDQEMIMAEHRLNRFCAEESDVLKLVEVNQITLFECEDAEMIEKAEELFDRSYPGHARPTQWYEAKYRACMSGLGSLKIVMKRGKCAICYKHLQEFVIPQMFRKSLERYVNSPELREAQRKYIAEEDFEDGIEYLRIGKSLFAKHWNEREKAAKSRIPKSADGESRDLVDIEDAVSKKLLAPCVTWLYHRLIDRAHLKYMDRRTLAWMLTDHGMKDEQVLQLLQKHFKRGGTSDIEFQAKYATVVVHYREDLARYSPNCESLQEVDSDPSKAECYGCPFKFLDEKKLDAFLKMIGVDNDSFRRATVAVAKGRGRDGRTPYSLACSRVFTSFHGFHPRLHNRPERYYLNALEKKVENERRERTHVSVEFTQ
jgi:hypothetical protein